MLSRALSECLINTVRLGASAASIENPFQRLTSLWVKKRFWMSGLNLLWWSFRPSPRGLSLGQRSTAQHPLATSPPQGPAEPGLTPWPPFLQTRQTLHTLHPQPFLAAQSFYCYCGLSKGPASPQRTWLVQTASAAWHSRDLNAQASCLKL